MDDFVGLKVNQAQYDNLSRDLVLDLVALFKVMEEDVKSLLQKAITEDWTPDRLIKEIEQLI